MKTFRSLITILCLVAIMPLLAGAQYKVETFGKFRKMKAVQDLPIDFKTTFQLKATVFVQLTYPSEPAFYTIDCYHVDDRGREKLIGTTDIKHFEKEPGKVIKSPQSLGMMYDAGNYKIKAWRQSDKVVVAESEFTVTGELEKPARTPATVVFCEDTDDNFNPIRPVTTIRAGESVNFLARLQEGIGAKFFIWAAFEIKSDSDELLYKDMQEHVDNETNRWFATIQKTTFSRPGKYAVYMLYQNATNSGMTVKKPTNYYARGVLIVK